MTPEMSITQRLNFDQTAASIERLIQTNIAQAMTLVMAAHVEGASLPDIQLRINFFYHEGDTYAVTKIFIRDQPYNIKAQA